MTQPGLDFTGERVVLGRTPKRIVDDHLARYRLLAEHITGKTALDLGCGTGYGSSLLAGSGARAVLAFDISPDAIASAREQSLAVGPLFAVASADSIPLPDHSLDMVACIEVIEHVADADAVLREITRVIRSDGRMLLSTPNRLVASAGRGPAQAPVNPFHVREYSAAELQRLLGRYFAKVTLLGQRFLPRPLIWFPLRLIRRFRRPDGLSPLISRLSVWQEPHYFLAWCAAPRAVAGPSDVH